MAKTYDYIYRYRPAPAHCRIRVYQAGGQNICLATKSRRYEPGATMADAAGRIATQVECWHHPVHDGRLLWVEHDECTGVPDPEGVWETFAFVAFERDAAGELCRPARRPTGRAAVEALVGEALGA